jgi:oxygen-independent coproporphyrinogen-3 oxidase
LSLSQVAQEFGESAVAGASETIADLVETGLLDLQGGVIRLTPRGRLLSNEVFERFIVSVEHVE